jgi:hypothetical protein
LISSRFRKVLEIWRELSQTGKAVSSGSDLSLELTSACYSAFPSNDTSTGTQLFFGDHIQLQQRSRSDIRRALLGRYHVDEEAASDPRVSAVKVEEHYLLVPQARSE